MSLYRRRMETTPMPFIDENGRVFCVESIVLSRRLYVKVLGIPFPMRLAILLRLHGMSPKTHNEYGSESFLR